jgi:serine-type D-Ala-D-Ala carboxypeptidase/endopeptidase (penicillin-binding protein 4)
MVEDLVVTNKVSQNLHAELLLRLLGKILGPTAVSSKARASSASFSSRRHRRRRLFPLRRLRLELQRPHRPARSHSTSAYASHQPWGPAWRNTFPIAGVDGTLAGRFRNSPLKGRLGQNWHAQRDNTLSGYLTTATKTMAFSIMVNGHRPGSDAEFQAIDRIAEAIAAASSNPVLRK